MSFDVFEVDRRKSTLSRVLLSLVLCALTWSTTAAAHQQGYGMVWAYDPVSASYDATASPYAYNDSGGSVRITRSSTGRYSVLFEDIDAISATGGNVQVSAYGATSNYCKVVFWTRQAVNVACFDSAGNPADTVYTVLFLLPDSHANNYAYAWANDPTSASYTPSGLYSYNAGGAGAITATRSAVGRYEMAWSGFDAVGSGGGHVQVTAYGSGNARCSVRFWGSSAANVGCYDPSGTPVDSLYTILYWRPDPDDDGLAFAWANSATSASYTPSTTYSYNAAGGTVTASRLATGVYRMSWDGMQDVGINGGHIQVSGYTGFVGGDVNCGIGSWSPSSTSVYCYDSAGSPVDSQYTVLFLKPPKKNWTQDFAFAWANQPTATRYEPSTFYSFNRARRPIEITRSGVGDYAVTFPWFDYVSGGGNVQVSHYRGGGGYCNIAFWSATTVHVRCFDASGAASDEYFTVLFLKSQPGTTSTSYAWANSPGSASYTPSPFYSFNPSGGAVTATRSGRGEYTMTWTGAGGLGVDGGHVQVTAYGGGNQRCKVRNWGSEDVNVSCFDSAGNPTDSQYTVLYLRPDVEDAALAFAWANEAASASYAPSAFYAFNSGDGVITATRSGVGSYAMNFSGFGLQGIEGGHVQVSAYGAGDTRCGVSSWGAQTVFVNCHDSTGAPADSRYDVLYLRPIAAVAAAFGDDDADLVPNGFDNCVEVENPGQEDVDEGEDDDSSLPGTQHYGDACDVDLDNDGIVGASDFFGKFRPCLGQRPTGDCASSDLDGDGVVGASDFFGKLRPALGTTPGPGVTEP